MSLFNYNISNMPGYTCPNADYSGVAIGYAVANTAVSFLPFILSGIKQNRQNNECSTTTEGLNEKINTILKKLNTDEKNFESAVIDPKYDANFSKATTTFNDSKGAVDRANSYINTYSEAYNNALDKRDRNETLNSTELNIIKNYENYKNNLPKLEEAQEKAEAELNKAKELKDAAIKELDNDKEELRNLISQRNQETLEDANGNIFTRTTLKNYNAKLENGVLKTGEKYDKGDAKRAVDIFMEHMKSKSSSIDDKRKAALNLVGIYENHLSKENGERTKLLTSAYNVAKEFLAKNPQ